MITTVNHDVLKHPSNAIIHQANCYHTMGAGIAKRIRTVYPEAFKADCDTIRGDINKLGTFSVAYTKDGSYIYNLYGQHKFGRDKRYTNYEAVYTGLSSIKEHMIDNTIKSVNIPMKMGCNNAGGSWKVINTIIYDIFDNTSIEVFICNYDNKLMVNKKVYDQFFN